MTRRRGDVARRGASVLQGQSLRHRSRYGLPMEDGTRYQPSPDQVALAAEVASPFDRLLPVPRLHSQRRESDTTWSSLRDLGLFGITLPESAGGSSLGVTEEVLIVIDLGRQLASPSIFATIAANCFPFLEVAPEITRSIVAAGYRREGDDRIIMIDDCNPGFLLVRHPSEAALSSRPRNRAPSTLQSG